MRTYEQLTEVEQKQAQEQELNDLLRDVVEGLRFDDSMNDDDLQARIDKAMEQAEKMQTPWFAHEYVMDDEYVADSLRSMALNRAIDALYLEDREHCIRLGA